MLRTKAPLLDSGWRNYLRRVPNDCGLYFPGLRGGGSTVVDYSGYANHGTITGATWVRLPSGLWVLDFNGTSNLVSVAHNATIDFADEDFTILIWVKVDENDITTEDRLIYKGLTGGADKRYEVSVDAGGDLLALYIDDGTTKSNASYADLTNWADATWHLLAFRRDTVNNALKVFLDGVDVTDGGGADNTGSIANSNPLTIGCRWDAAASAWIKGSIGGVRVIRQAISPDGLQYYYDRERRLFGV